MILNKVFFDFQEDVLDFSLKRKSVCIFILWGVKINLNYGNHSSNLSLFFSLFLAYIFNLRIPEMFFINMTHLSLELFSGNFPPQKSTLIKNKTIILEDYDRI